MPLKNGYACLKGRPIGNRIATSRKPHYQVHISANGIHYRIAINVQSNDGSEVEFLVRSRFVHPITDALSPLAQGRIEVESAPDGVALDFIRVDPRFVRDNPERRPGGSHRATDGAPLVAAAGGRVVSVVDCFANDNSGRCASGGRQAGRAGTGGAASGPCPPGRTL